jgi:hypothetical protein
VRRFERRLGGIDLLGQAAFLASSRWQPMHRHNLGSDWAGLVARFVPKS